MPQKTFYTPVEPERPDTVEESPLFKLINPDSIAFLGASNNFGSMGTSQLSSLLELGFEGSVYPVHPKESRILGLKAYRHVADLPEIPDLAILILPTKIVADTLIQCGQKGIKHVIIVSGGFQESGVNGGRLQQQLIQIARQYDMRFLGPNCLGVANPHHKLNTTFLPHVGQPGYVGMVSQSGSFITQMFDYLARMGLGFSTAISVGNEADIDMVAGLEYLALCPHTRVITLYIETIRNPEAFMRVVKDITPQKPIVAYYVGGSESGRRASLSHTGALSGPDVLYEGLFRQTGIIRAKTIEELFDISAILGNKTWPQGDRVIIQTHSGGPGAVAADACDQEGLTVAPLPPSLKNKLADLVPHTGTVGNPVDITFSKDRLAYFSSIPDSLLSAEYYDMLLVYVLMPKQMFARVLRSMDVPEDQIDAETSKLMDEAAASFSRIMQSHAKPVIGFSFHAQDSSAIKFFHTRNIPVMPSPHRAARAIAAVCRYVAWRKSANAT